MIKSTKKVLSMLLALVMMVGVFAPTMVKAAEGETGVIIHKILMPKADLDNHTDEGKNPAYNGGQINDITGYFGDNAKEVAGVAFDIYKEVDSQETGDLSHDSAILGGLGTVDKFYRLVEDNYMSKTSDYDTLTLVDGTYIIVEDKEASTYTGENSEVLAASKAVPTKIELPQAKPDGTGNFTIDDPLHLYPKNSEEKPDVEKTFGDGTTDTKNVNIGDIIPYQINTIIKAGSEYKTLRWTDTMVNGLDFVTGSIQVEYGTTTDEAANANPENYAKIGDLEFNVDYKLVETIRGFILELTESGRAKVQDVDNNIKIKITYDGILNESAEVDTDIPNEVKFEYGNNPSEFSEPLEGQPKEGKITVNKTWADGPAPDGVTATFKVYEKETGKEVGTITIASPATSGELTGLDNDKTYIVVEDTVSGYLPDYITFVDGVLEVTNKKNPNPDPVEPTPPNVKTHGKKFVKTSEGENPDRLAGAEFVIMNEAKIEYLALKPAGEQAQDESAYKTAQKNYIDAINRKNELIAIPEADRTDEQKTELTKLNGTVDTDGSIAQLKKARDDAYEALNMQWTWTANEGEAFVFVSDEEGRFEVRGLKAGTYHLKEIKAPAGYALPSDPFVLGGNGFTVGDNSYSSEGVDINYDPVAEGETGTNDAKRVNNKKVTIPQTGGIGTAIFTVAGIALMGGAAVAMKKRGEEDEE